MFGSRDFPTFKWKFAFNFCSEFALLITSIVKLKIANLNALFRLRFSFLFNFTAEIYSRKQNICVWYSNILNI